MLSKFRRAAAAGLAGLATTLAGAGALAGEWGDINLPVGVTSISRGAYDLHMLMLWLTVVMGVIVFGVMLVSIVLHRKSAGHKPAQFRHSTLAEIVWTIIPIVILVAFAIPATKTLIDMEDTSAPRPFASDGPGRSFPFHTTISWGSAVPRGN